MGLIIPPNLISLLKDKHLLLDTNIFIVTSLHLHAQLQPYQVNECD